eukprot:187674_1
MSLNAAIKFRFLYQQLTRKEKKNWLYKSLKTNENIIVNSLFAHIVNESSTNEQSDGYIINDTISNIIRNRKKKHEQTMNISSQLSEISPELIGHISSFLTQFDYIAFRCTNRSIYLGCNTSNALQKLDLCEISDYSNVDLKLFPKVKHLKVKLCKFDKLSHSNNLNELQSITLDATGTFTGIYSTGTFTGNIDSFMASTLINFESVTTLTCSGFSHFSDNFQQLLQKFPNLQYLYLHNHSINIIDVTQLFPNLKGLRLDGSHLDLNRALIHTYGHKLDYLFFAEYSQYKIDYDFSSITFNKLEQLQMIDPTMNSIDDILMSAKNLKQIRIAQTSDTTLTTKDTINAWTKLIASNLSLEYLETFSKDSKSMKYALKGIENGLFQTRNRKRHQITIQIATYVENVCAFEEDVVSNICKTIGWLEASKMTNFMIVLKSYKLSIKAHEYVMTELRNCSSKIRIYTYGQSLSVFVITNKGCKINGFEASWKINMIDF